MTTSNQTSVVDVGFVVVKRLTKNGVEPPKEIPDIVSTMCIRVGNNAFATVISVYAPTLMSSESRMERFYEELRFTLVTDKRITRHYRRLQRTRWQWSRNLEFGRRN